MSAVQGKNTRPELAVRSAIHNAGFRYSLHRKDLPGKPDLVLPKYKTVVFIHGCFVSVRDAEKLNFADYIARAAARRSG